ncbi:hypothetical protein [Chryseobacterium potabilaquae]|uniref:Lipoprotein with Yx(FWY)xxD motif n=1 Tax=Chryseobacterium potabilaquae TaxID=2675057 RepID=A0A6N4X6N8_9FLAO|nr:hypothetical protein [Chryseobacterium potabilaquae]CAA7196361.1 hypothetical protein CHRY9293_02458 [Chryseobacterium potabilaquae]
MKKNLLTKVSKISLLLMAGLLMYNCNNSNDDMKTPPVTPPVVTPESRTIKVMENATFGKILTDQAGKTLYFFSDDYKGVSECNNGCLNIWPIFYTDNVNMIDPSLNQSDFATITRADGKKQTTYKGWPLYYFANDTNIGDTAGDKVGDVWYVAKPDYTVMYASGQLVGENGKNYTTSANAQVYTEGSGKTMYLTDANGRTLYAFASDKKDTNNFTASDFSNNGVWPIVGLNKMKFPSIMNPADFGIITVFGRTQLTYRGWPVYYFGGDGNRGDNKGVSVPNPGVWPIFNTGTPIAPL